MTDFINPNDTGGKTVSEVIKEMTGGGGADYCFECIGSTSVMAEAFQSTRNVRATCSACAVETRDQGSVWELVPAAVFLTASARNCHKQSTVSENL
jgi:Zn-dependent alcohol dehydrogenase